MADGYTIGLKISPGIGSYPITRTDAIGYSKEQFPPLLVVALDPGVLAVAADSSYQTLADFVAAAKSLSLYRTKAWAVMTTWQR